MLGRILLPFCRMEQYRPSVSKRKTEVNVAKNNFAAPAAPFVKWAGGKRQILEQIISFMPATFSTYYEPFLGGGAVLFALQPQSAVVNDISAELVHVYQVIRENVEDLIADLRQHKNEKDYFYWIRGLDRDRQQYKMLTSVQQASRTIYLNKTCFNGLYRVNKKGQFNVPFGNYRKPNIVNEDILRAASSYFNRAKIKFTCLDFAVVLADAEKDDFVYLDPPYDPASETANFTDYSKDGFARKEQIRLKKSCDQLHKKGIRFLLSNAATGFILDLYQGYNVEIIRAKRAICARGDRRGEVDEVLVKNF